MGVEGLKEAQREEKSGGESWPEENYGNHTAIVCDIWTRGTTARRIFALQNPTGMDTTCV